jgi:hypothetical protein
MAVRVFWDNDDQTIIHYQFDENWTWDEFFPAKAHAQELINTVSHKVGVILETHHNGVIPHNLLGNFRNGLRTKHPNTAIVVIVVTRPFIRTMISTVRALSPLAFVHLEMAFTLDEARLLIHDYLRTLQPDTVKQSNF